MYNYETWHNLLSPHSECHKGVYKRYDDVTIKGNFFKILFFDVGNWISPETKAST